MFYSDEETKRNDEIFQEKLLAARAYMEENKDRFEQHKIYMDTVIMPLMEKEFPTPEEVELILKQEAIVMEMNQKMHELQEIFAESLTRQATYIMDIARQKAAEGVEGAKEAYEDLKKSYAGFMESSISKN